LVLIIEVEGDNPQQVIDELSERLNINFFSGNMEVPFLIKPKGEVKQEVIQAVMDFLIQKGFTPLLTPSVREESRNNNTRGGEQREKLVEVDKFDVDKFIGNSVRVLNKTLRAGQVVEHPGDVLVIGDVNPGAEIRAAGNVIVLGELRGIAWAGYPGNKDAVIIALKMKPQQLRIGNIFAPGEGVEDNDNRPKVAKVVEDNNYYEIEIEPLV